MRKLLLWSEDEMKGFLEKLYSGMKKKNAGNFDSLDLIANKIEWACAQYFMACSYPAHDQNVTFSV